MCEESTEGTTWACWERRGERKRATFTRASQNSVPRNLATRLDHVDVTCCHATRPNHSLWFPCPLQTADCSACPRLPRWPPHTFKLSSSLHPPRPHTRRHLTSSMHNIRATKRWSTMKTLISSWRRSDSGPRNSEPKCVV